MATAAEVLLPLRAGLVAVPAIGQPGICRFCHSACDPGYGQCYPCLEADRIVGAVEVLAISMSVAGGLLHRHLRGYKDERSAAVRARMALRLAALTAVFVENHIGCIGPFDSVVLVPSPARTAVEPILARVRALRDVHRPALGVAGVGAKDDLRTDRFSVIRDVSGERLLVLDDTFTSGASLFSAVGALRAAGASIAGPVVLGRHVQSEWGPSRHMLAWLGPRTWEDRRCARCDGERANPGQLL